MYKDSDYEFCKNDKELPLDKDLPFNYDRMDMEINEMPDNKIDTFLKIFILLFFFSPFIVYPILNIIDYATK